MHENLRAAVPSNMLSQLDGGISLLRKIDIRTQPRLPVETNLKSSTTQLSLLPLFLLPTGPIRSEPAFWSSHCRNGRHLWAIAFLYERIIAAVWLVRVKPAFNARLHILSPARLLLFSTTNRLLCPFSCKVNRNQVATTTILLLKQHARRGTCFWPGDPEALAAFIKTPSGAKRTSHI